jgi:acetyl esterase/lipase
VTPATEVTTRLPPRRRRQGAAGVLAALALAGLAPSARAQNDVMTPMATPAQPNAIALGTGALPDAPVAESWYRQYGSAFARDVQSATLTPYLPDPARANGTAIVIAPGGGFRTLSMENEGSEVARRLAQEGVAAFVLKYRLHQTPAGMAAFQQDLAAMFAGAGARTRPRLDGDLTPQIADARAALALVRARAAQWRVDPARVGMIGFSAGAMLTLATTLSDARNQPDFIATIYGPLDTVEAPANAPPLFVALAADDPFFAGRGYGLIESWTRAKRPVEFHLYEQGGHGFGMYPKPTTSTGWFDAYVRWLRMHGLLTRTTGREPQR